MYVKLILVCALFGWRFSNAGRIGIGSRYCKQIEKLIERHTFLQRDLSLESLEVKMQRNHIRIKCR